MTAAGTAVRNFRIGTCPCCHVALYMNVDLATEVREPHLDEQGRAVANVTACITAAEVEHNCTRDDR